MFRTEAESNNITTTPIMEHSYTRDFRLLESSQTAMTRTLMIHRPPQCPSCHTHSHDERIDLEESHNPPIPSYNEESARRAMQESENIVVTARNSVSDEDDWEERVNTFGWTVQQFKLFDRVARLLDMDRLARLTNTEKQHEPVHRRTVIDKSVSRLRQALASVSWETRLTQWLHVLLMENLPPSYLAIYIDILQTLHAKLPLLANKMIFGSTLNVGQELLRPVLKKPWEPIVSHKNRKLPGQPYIVIAPSVPNFSQPTARQQKWFSLFATMSSVIPIQGTQGKTNIDKQSLQLLAENMVATTRAKIQQVRSTTPNRSIILVGFDAGSAIAIQVGLVESVSCVICLGFSYNTYNGVRGTPDDHIVDIGCPVLFVIGQNSARASHEEIEMLRDRMSTQTSLVVVGAADECLRVSKTKRKIEGVTQSMVDNMVADEIAEFATNCLVSPPRTKQSAMGGQFTNGTGLSETIPQSQRPESDLTAQRKRKHTPDSKTDFKLQKKSQNRRSTKTNQPPDGALATSQTSQDALDVAIQSILPTTPDKQIKSEKIILPLAKNDEVLKFESGSTQIISARASTPIVLPALKRDSAHSSLSSGVLQPQQQHQGNVNVKLIESNQLIHLKPATGTTQKFYSIKSSSKPVVSVLPNASPGVSDGAISSTEISSPPKFTIVRSVGSTPAVFSSTADASATSKVAKDLSETNIFDLPIVFADSDGVIQEGSPEKPKPDMRPASGGATATVTSTVTGLGGSPTSGNAEGSATPAQPAGNRFITLQQPSAGGLPQISIGKNSKQLVVINKGTLKPVDPSIVLPVGTKINLPLSVASSAANTTAGGTVVTTGVGARPKFTKLLLTKPLTTTGTGSGGVVKNLGELLSGSKIGFVNCATGVKQSSVTGTGTPVTVQQNKIQSIVINPYNANKLQQTVAGNKDAAGSSIPIVGSNKILIKTTTSALSAASAAPSLVGRNLKFNIVSTSTGTKQSTATRNVDGSPKEK
uniref:KANL3/Tex30 alpha/beta hydrolase-like domain-containing protein n=1 Tax=Anopheles stephensi TaxID=30069 RepID=A0A182Y8T9_ANOST